MCLFFCVNSDIIWILRWSDCEERSLNARLIPRSSNTDTLGTNQHQRSPWIVFQLNKHRKYFTRFSRISSRVQWNQDTSTSFNLWLLLKNSSAALLDTEWQYCTYIYQNLEDGASGARSAFQKMHNMPKKEKGIIIVIFLFFIHPPSWCRVCSGWKFVVYKQMVFLIKIIYRNCSFPSILSKNTLCLQMVHKHDLQISLFLTGSMLHEWS